MRDHLVVRLQICSLQQLVHQTHIEVSWSNRQPPACSSGRQGCMCVWEIGRWRHRFLMTLCAIWWSQCSQAALCAEPNVNAGLWCTLQERMWSKPVWVMRRRDEMKVKALSRTIITCFKYCLSFLHQDTKMSPKHSPSMAMAFFCRVCYSLLY